MQVHEYALQHPELSDEELKRDLRANSSDLGAGDINSIVNAREKPKINIVEELRTRIISSLESKTELIDRNQARVAVENQIRKQLGVEKLPSAVNTAIDEAIVQVYGEKSRKGFVPKGEGLFNRLF